MEGLPPGQVVAASAPTRERDQKLLDTEPLVEPVRAVIDVGKFERRGRQVDERLPAELGGEGHGRDAGIEVHDHDPTQRTGHLGEIQPAVHLQPVHVGNGHTAALPAQPGGLELPSQGLGEQVDVDQVRSPVAVRRGIDATSHLINDRYVGHGIVPPGLPPLSAHPALST